ncbi:IS5 family transposase [Legionella antarctica]|uniref:IS5 family transposase n=1 Tax=Legionella antarctica TaxID=2708020 RepID=A0A6F8T6N2_9GAMM|nr:transposase [Legionella antarctica]BCA93679.1 IS5 family transposase [Legionella antarctica]BCA94728.1 IS5 family transposase [Legionella antarctica]BCA95890.1 IS5 family transposase [Legionella antarctica]BCA96344.1 IS5 family transposase [Legionella antarctica]
MSLDVNGFDEPVTGGTATITVGNDHRLVKLAQKLPWDEMLQLVLPDLQRTEKKHWWMGRPLRIRIHLGVYVLQQMFNLTDRFAEQQVRDNAAFRLFCGYGLIKKWHAPDHTKIETFRSRLSPEKQRRLANLIAQQAVKLNYANPTELDIDSTVQEANIAYPAIANLLIKVAVLASKVGKGLNQLCSGGMKQYCVGLSNLKQIALYYFNLKRKDVGGGILSVVLQRLWRETYADVLPILNDLYLFGAKLASGKYWALRRSVETLSWRGTMLLQNVHGYLFEGIINTSISSLHAYEVGCFNKGKLNKGVQFGRVYQLGRIGGNFLFVGECTSTYMPDAQSLPLMLNTHEHLFGKGLLASVATDKGYYSLSNEQLLIEKGVLEIQLPRPDRTLNAARETTPWPIRQLLHHRRAGIEPLIGHTKHGGQLGRSRMKSDETTKSAGYAAVFGFNLRQLTRYLSGEVRPEIDKMTNIAANNANSTYKTVIQGA